MAEELAGKVAVVSGGGGGMMRDIAVMFVTAGARVVLADTNRDRLDEAGGLLGASAATLCGDLSDESAVEEMVALGVSRFGSVDIGVNSVGARANASLLDESLETFTSTIQQHLTGTFLAIKRQARQMIAQGHGGAIINISSISGVQAMEGFAAYGSAKAAVIHLTKIAALELGPHNIRINSIAPGQVRPESSSPGAALLADPENPFVQATPLRRIGRGDDIAKVALFLASDASSWVTGQVLAVDGGISVTRYPSYRDTPRRR